MGRRLHNAFSSKPSLDVEAVIDTIWEPAESRNEKAQAETLLIKKELGVSEAQAQIELGYTAIERASFVRDKMRNTALAIRRPPIIPEPNAAAGASDEETTAQDLNQTENEAVVIDNTS